MLLIHSFIPYARFSNIIHVPESQATQPTVSLGKLREEIVVGERLGKDEISKSVFGFYHIPQLFPKKLFAAPRSCGTFLGDD